MKRLSTLVATTTAALLALALAPASAGAAVSAGDWAQRDGGAGHTGQINSPGGLNPHSVSGLRRVRSSSTPIARAFAVADGQIYGTTIDNHLVATSAVDGHVLWSTPSCGGREQNFANGGDTTPAVTADAVWLSDGPFLTGVRRSNGHRFACVGVGTDASYENASPTIAGGVLYSTTPQAVLAFNASTGARIWRGAIPAGWQVAEAPVVADGMVVVSTVDPQFQGGIFALSARDGSVQWMVRTRTFASGLAATGGRVYAGGSPGAWDIQTGATIWTRPGYRLDGGLSVSGGRVFLVGGESDSSPGGGNPDGDMIALDANTGQTLWETNFASEGGGVATVGNGVVYVVDPIDSGSVFLFNAATGALIRALTHPAPEPFYDEQPVVVDGTLYLGGFANNRTFIDTWSQP